MKHTDSRRRLGRWSPRRAVAAAVVGLVAVVAATPSSALATAAPASFDSPMQSASPWPGGKWSPPAATYGSNLDRQISVRMRDGVVLKVDVSYPTDRQTGARINRPFPVLLTQTPYVSTKPAAGDYFVQRGYIYVTAYVRGTTYSDGKFGFFSQRDAQDGAELVEWAAEDLKNSNGTVGLTGGSYAGLNQMQTAAAAGPRSPIKALAPYCMGAEFYRETYFAGGIPTQTLNWQRVIEDSTGSASAGEFGKKVANSVSSGGELAYDGDFWQKRTTGNLAKQVVDYGIPALLWSSSGDIYAQSSLELYAYMQNAYRDAPTFGPMRAEQRATGRYQIIMSQGGHCANIDERITLEWFDTWLKGMKTGIQNTNYPLHAHELVSNRWLSTSAYPVAPTYTKYHLAPGGKLTDSIPSTKSHDEVAWAQPAEDSTLEYTTPELSAGGTIAGPVSASFYASSTTSDLELIATLQLIHPNGSTTTLTSGAVDAAMAALDANRSWYDVDGVPVRPYGKYASYEPITPGAVNKYDFAISPRFAAIPPGSKLRLRITTQTPSAKCTPQLGTDACAPTDTQAAGLAGNTTSLFYGQGQDSSLNLPLLKANCFVTNDTPNTTLPYWNRVPVVTRDDAPCQR